MFLVEHDGQVRFLDGEENVVDIRTHVTLLEQRRAEENPLRPLSLGVVLRVLLVVRVGPEVEVFQACVINKICENASPILLKTENFQYKSKEQRKCIP